MHRRFVNADRTFEENLRHSLLMGPSVTRRRAVAKARRFQCVTASHFISIARFPFSTGVRRVALFAGAVCALFTGGLPFLGTATGLVMGRAVLLPSTIAFLLHLGVALLYGALFSLTLWRSRDWGTAVGAAMMSVALYLLNVTVFADLEAIVLDVEAHVLAAHALFGVVFTFSFKLAELGEADAELAPVSPSSHERA